MATARQRVRTRARRRWHAEHPDSGTKAETQRMREELKREQREAAALWLRTQEASRSQARLAAILRDSVQALMYGGLKRA